jgi:hypothetical protein
MEKNIHNENLNNDYKSEEINTLKEKENKKENSTIKINTETETETEKETQENQNDLNNKKGEEPKITKFALGDESHPINENDEVKKYKK